MSKKFKVNGTVTVKQDQMDRIEEGDEDDGDSSQKFIMKPDGKKSQMPEKIDEQENEDEEIVDSDVCFD